MDRLLDVTLELRGPRSRCTDLVPLGRDVCTKCGGPVQREAIGQPALFRHGGYGGTQMTAFVVCLDTNCRQVRIAAVYEVRPDRRNRCP